MRTSLARRQKLGVLAVMAMVSASCTTATPDPTTTSVHQPGVTAPETTSTTQPVYPEVVLPTGVITSLSTTNIWSVYALGATVYDGLVLQGQPAFLYTLVSPTGTLMPVLAESAEVPMGEADGDRWVIEIPVREGLTWSDGEAVDANDAVFTFETVKTLGLGGNFHLFWPVAGGDDAAVGLVAVEATDPHTLTLTWNRRPGLAQWQFGVAFAPILPEHYWAPHVAAAQDADGLHAVSGLESPGFGATLTIEHQPGVLAMNVANESYPYRGASYTVYANGAVDFSHPTLGDETWGGEPSGDVLIEYNERFVLSETPFNLYSNRDAAAAALIDGTIDFWANPLPMWPDLGSLRRKFTEAGGLTNASTEGTGLFYLAFNTRRFPGNSQAFRRAVDCMIEKDFITDTYMADAVIPIDSTVFPGLTFWHNPNVSSTCAGQTKGGRLQSAIEILKGAGWSWEQEPVFDSGADQGFGDVQPGVGLTGPDGETIQPIRMTVPSPAYDVVRATYSFWAQVYMTELGIPVRAEPTDFATLSTSIETLDWDMYVFGWALGDVFPNHLVTLFHSRNDSAAGGANTSGYSSSEFDELADQFSEATDIEHAKDLSHQMQEVIAGDVPIIVLYTSNHHYTYRNTFDSPFPDLLYVITRGAGGLPGLIKRS